MLDPLVVLKKYWGFDSFRPRQLEIIESVLDGHDTLALLPTGGGKSITFQVPGMILDGMTLVVAPLVSLMKDQVDKLRKIGIKAVYLHSGMTSREIALANERVRNGRCKFLYVAPERLQNENFIANLKLLHVRLIAVDEAHCISQWGYDFRPSYLNIGKLRKVFLQVPVLALTATATHQVAEDICANLNMDNPVVVVKSFRRDNIQYVVRETDDKLSQMLHILNRTQGSSIVYTRSRRRTQEVAEYLDSAGITSAYYHAGLEPNEKDSRQNAWQNDELRVMVATNAFGMGIDKPDVRVVIHIDPPSSLEEYYQEAGRAGRDGEPSFAVLLVGKRDKATLRRRLTDAFPERDFVKKVYERASNFLHLAIGEGEQRYFDFDLEKFTETFGMNPRSVKASFNILGAAGYMDFTEETENRARVMMTVDRNELFRIPLSQRADRTLQILLRNCPGIFTDYVFFYEPSLAFKGGMAEADFYEGLIELNHCKILHYVPRRRSPVIYLPRRRVEPRYVAIGKDAYDNRKKAMEERIEAVVEYMTNRTCRVRHMLRYFGEETTDCGTCDVCLETRRNRRGADRLTDAGKDLAASVMDVLRNTPGGMCLKEFSSHIKVSDERLDAMLSFLCDEGFILFDGTRYRLPD